MSMRLAWATAAALILGGCAADGRMDPEPAPVAEAASLEGGAALVRRSCAGCHAVERTGDSPMAAAPPFRTLGVEYPVRDLQEAFAEGLVTTHPAMPAIELQPQEIADVIAWLEHVSGTGG
ncbi:MAG: c-type cytochrome [Brevundimonas sp.]|nr:c-type cytochrome [Brevundimonas sp.]